MDFFKRDRKVDRDLKLAKIWFGRLADFHNKPNQPRWEFTVDDVIAFSRKKRDIGWPAYKHRLVVTGLMHYREQVQHRSSEDLKPIQRTLGEIAQLERARDEGYDNIEDVVGVIDPNEEDVIQTFRRTLRRDGADPLKPEGGPFDDCEIAVWMRDADQRGASIAC